MNHDSIFNRFEKSPGCPENEQLLAFERGTDGADAPAVADHLKICEFCSLLLDLLRSHPEELPVVTPPPPMPEALRCVILRQRPPKPFK